MSSVEAFTGIRYGRGLATLLVGATANLVVIGEISAGHALPVVLTTTAVVVALCAVVGADLSRVQVALNEGGLAYRSGLGAWRHFAWSAFTEIEHSRVSTTAVFGLGVRQTHGTLRHLVGPGPALHLHTRAGDDLWLSVPEDLTLARLETYRHPPAR